MSTDEKQMLNPAQLHSGHFSRLRNKALKFGVESLSEHEILELILTFLSKRKNMNEVAHNLLNSFGSLFNVCNAEISDLIKMKEITERTAAFLKLLPDFYSAYINSADKKEKKLLTIRDVIDTFAVRLHTQEKESFVVACLDAKNRLIGSKIFTSDKMSKVEINISEVTKYVLSLGTDAVVLAHNHPSNDIEPSGEDVILTKKLQTILHLNDILLLEHVIIGKDDYFSFRRRGFLEDYDDFATSKKLASLKYDASLTTPTQNMVKESDAVIDKILGNYYKSGK